MFVFHKERDGLTKEKKTAKLETMQSFYRATTKRIMAMLMIEMWSISNVWFLCVSSHWRFVEFGWEDREKLASVLFYFVMKWQLLYTYILYMYK